MSGLSLISWTFVTTIDHILIVGGGTAGWLTGAYLAKHLAANGAHGVRVTLVESSEVGSIGVGEGTFPTIAKTLAALGIEEARFMRGSAAAFKQGIKFIDWVHPPSALRRRHYYHPFALPRQVDDVDLLPCWLLGDAGADRSLADAVTLQEKVCEAGCAPKRSSDASYRGPLNYAYHVDAGQFAAFLKTIAQQWGVAHRIGHVQGVDLDEQGAIAGVRTREHGVLRADLYIDCTGFRAELIGRALQVPLRSCNDVLFVDRALAMQVPYTSSAAPVPPYTIATAQEAGWTWDIALAERRGVGYVYSSRHTDEAKAEAVLREYVGDVACALPIRRLSLQVGWREQPWVKNCIAVGLAGGFLEPLESTGILMIEAAAYLIASLLPRHGTLVPAALRFNTLMTRRYERILDFIKLHYHLTQRSDTAFWRDNADPASAPESLLEHLSAWRYRPPTRFDFIMDHESFALANYQFVLYGMEFPTRLHASVSSGTQRLRARAEFARVQQASERAAATLPRHRELLNAVYQPQFQFAAPQFQQSPAMLVR